MENIMTIRAPERIRNELSKEAKRTGIPRNALVLQILSEWLERRQP